MRHHSRYLAGKCFLVLLFLFGCARVSIDSKKPIKLDVTMRLDIYQHVSKDVEAIEDMISGPKKDDQAQMTTSSFFRLGLGVAYAQEEVGLPSGIQAAVDRRRDRLDVLRSYEQRGILGEGKDGFVVVRQAGAGKEASDIAQAENSDRQMIYTYIAGKNGVAVHETAGIFASRIQSDAPAGTPLETERGEWKNK